MQDVDLYRNLSLFFKNTTISFKMTNEHKNWYTRTGIQGWLNYLNLFLFKCQSNILFVGVHNEAMDKAMQP